MSKYLLADAQHDISSPTILESTVEANHRSIRQILPYNEESRPQTVVTKKISSTQEKLQFFMSSQRLDAFILAFILIYTVIVFVNVSFEDSIEDYRIYILITELVILSIFAIEIILKLYAFRVVFIKDPWNVFDIFIVICCFILTIIEIEEPGLVDSGFFRVSGILRLLRIIVMFRKVNQMRRIRQKIKVRNLNSSFTMTTPAENVIEILANLSQFEWIEQDEELLKNLKWCVNVIQKRKVYNYEVNQSADQGIHKWIGEYVRGPNTDKVVREESILRVNSEIEEYKENGVHKPRSKKFLLVLPKEILDSFAHFNRLDFNIFELSNRSSGNELVTVLNYQFYKDGLIEELDIPQEEFGSFISEIQKNYNEKNFYHNATHAADICQTMYYFLNSCGAKDLLKLSAEDICACYISAACHDVGHVGFTNAYLINTLDPLAILYNDRSVLENYHVSLTYTIMEEAKNNIFKNQTQQAYLNMRQSIIEMILTTDMAKHFDFLSLLKSQFQQDHVVVKEDKSIILEYLLHAADVSNCSKPWKISYIWSQKVLSEYFQQGEAEYEAGLPISPLCDRDIVDVPATQIGFIEVIVMPTFEAMVHIFPQFSENLRNWDKNRIKWKAMVMHGNEIELSEDEDEY